MPSFPLKLYFCSIISRELLCVFPFISQISWTSWFCQAKAKFHFHLNLFSVCHSTLAVFSCILEHGARNMDTWKFHSVQRNMLATLNVYSWNYYAYSNPMFSLFACTRRCFLLLRCYEGYFLWGNILCYEEKRWKCMGFTRDKICLGNVFVDIFMFM